MRRLVGIVADWAGTAFGVFLAVLLGVGMAYRASYVSSPPPRQDRPFPNLLNTNNAEPTWKAVLPAPTTDPNLGTPVHAEPARPKREEAPSRPWYAKYAKWNELTASAKFQGLSRVDQRYIGEKWIRSKPEFARLSDADKEKVLDLVHSKFDTTARRDVESQSPVSNTPPAVPSDLYALPSSPRYQPRVASHISDLYVGGTGGHWIESVSGDGEIIKLEDGSVWEVEAVDQADSAVWVPVSDVVVVDSRDPLYPYLLINKDENEKVHAKLLSQ